MGITKPATNPVTKLMTSSHPLSPPKHPAPPPRYHLPFGGPTRLPATATSAAIPDARHHLPFGGPAHLPVTATSAAIPLGRHTLPFGGPAHLPATATSTATPPGHHDLPLGGIGQCPSQPLPREVPAPRPLQPRAVALASLVHAALGWLLAWLASATLPRQVSPQPCPAPTTPGHPAPASAKPC